MKFMIILDLENSFYHEEACFLFSNIELAEKPLEGEKIQLGKKTFKIYMVEDKPYEEEYPAVRCICRSINSLCHVIINDPNKWKIEGSSQETENEILFNLQRISGKEYFFTKGSFLIK